MNKTEPPRLHIYEECLLLAIGDRTGNVMIGTEQAALLLASAILGELLVDEVISLERSDLPIKFHEAKAYGDMILDDAVAKLSSAKGSYSLQNWIGRISSSHKLLDKCAQQLCERGILKPKEEVGWFFNRRYYPELNPDPENKVRERIRTAILGDDEVDSRTATVIGLASQMELLNSFTTHAERKQYGHRVQAIGRSDSVSNASRSIAAQQQTAMLFAITGAFLMMGQ